MRPRQGWLGTTLMVLGLTGFALTMLVPRLPTAVLAPVATWLDPAARLLDGPAAISASAADAIAAASTGEPAGAVPLAPTAQQAAVTRLVIASIGLDTPVSVAPLVEHNGVTTWDVPKFVAGHAERSAGAGQPGNAIVMGHVTSLTLGNVFEHLDLVGLGDDVQVFSFDRRFEYRVTQARQVARTDVAVLDPTAQATLTLITCSGLWLPTVWDYSQRFVVRAELR